MLHSAAKFISAFFLVGFSVGLALPASANQVDQLFKQEQRALGQISDGRLNTMLSAPAPKAGQVQFSKSWLDAQPKAAGGAELSCLAEALYFEARGETVKGQFAVAEVIMNRVKSSRFPGSACSVIGQGTGRKHQCQFSFKCDGHAEVIANKQAYSRVSKVAKAVLDGRAPELVKGATHYHTNAVNPSWSRVFTRTASIGVHLFYRPGYKTASN